MPRKKKLIKIRVRKAESVGINEGPGIFGEGKIRKFLSNSFYCFNEGRIDKRGQGGLYWGGGNWGEAGNNNVEDRKKYILLGS